MDRNRSENSSEFWEKVSTNVLESNSNYRPIPIEYEQVVLPESYRNLIEKLAENIHEEWATLLIKNGWTYGEFRFDRRMTNTLVDYIPNFSERIVLERGKYEWRYGVIKNDRRKKHPSLVAFKDLNDDEKNFNRLKAENFLKSLLLLGYEVKEKE